VRTEGLTIGTIVPYIVIRNHCSDYTHSETDRSTGHAGHETSPQRRDAVLLTIALSFLVGLFGGNALPHFMRGITKERYPNSLGGSPVVNFVTGWAGLVITALLVHWARMDLHPLASFISVAVGLLLIGLFHSGPGAFGKP